MTKKLLVIATGLVVVAIAVVVIFNLMGPDKVQVPRVQPPCPGCASHKNWPPLITLTISRPKTAQCSTCSIKRRITGDAQNNELLGGHESNRISGGAGDDVIWGDFNPSGQPTRQTDRMLGGDGNDFIYGSHGRNIVVAGRGNDKIRVHYGRGVVDCGPGFDVYHVAKSRRGNYTFRHCEKVDYRTEAQGGVL